MDTVPASMLQLLIGGVLAALAALVSWRLHWLNGSGAWAAFGLGLVVFGLGGLSWAIVLLTFFFTSSILSKLFTKQKQTSKAFTEKGSNRDAGQVLANGFIAGLFVVFHVFQPDSWVAWTGFTAALAAANADTWATELGALSRHNPVLITSGKPVARGTSGGISLAGTFSAFLGAGLVAVVAWYFCPLDFPPQAVSWIPLITLSGLVGSMVDSILGACAQAIYYCSSCQKETEQREIHFCGSAVTYLRGWKWLDNDWVNLACTASAAMVAGLLLFLIQR